MKEFVELLPQIILPLILGGIFVYVFKIVSLRSYKISWIPCYAIGYILQCITLTIYDFLKIQNQLSILLELSTTCLASCIIAYVLAKIFRSDWFNKFRLKIGIYDTLEDNYWTILNDAEKGTIVTVYYFSEKRIVQGTISYLEDSVRYPQIALSNYTIRINNEEFVTRTDDDNSRLIIDTQKCDLIELTYDNKSRVLVERKIK